ncbi:MAG: HDOD domain-containing protein [Pseudomonadota bacterium]
MTTMIMTQPTELHSLVSHLDMLPAVPAVAKKILALQLDSDQGEMQLLRLIENEPTIAARLVGLANSPLFGATKKIVSVRDAAIVLGITRVKSISVGIVLMSTLTHKVAAKLNHNQLWLHSLGVALASRELCKKLPAARRPQEDEVFLAGLLHEIGYMVLADLAPDLSDRLQEAMAAEPDLPVEKVERNLLGTTHAELGAALAKHWNLPDNIVRAVRYHHSPQLSEACEIQPLACVIHLAERLSGPQGVDEYLHNDVTEEEWCNLGIDPADAEEVAEAIRQQSAEVQSLASTFFS